jgi:hypothetical protein
MLRSTTLATVLVSLALAACAAPASSETEGAAQLAADTQEQNAAQPRSALVRYEGSFATAGATYTLQITVDPPVSGVVTQTVWSTRFHASEMGRCGAFLSTAPSQASMRIRLSDASGKVLADNRQPAFVNSSVDLDSSACSDGLLANPGPVGKLETELSRDGFRVEVGNGAHLDLPGAYIGHGAAVVPASVAFTATGKGTVTSESILDSNNMKFVTEGSASYTLPKQIEFPVGTRDGMDPIMVTLAAR